MNNKFESVLLKHVWGNKSKSNSLKLKYVKNEILVPKHQLEQTYGEEIPWPTQIEPNSVSKNSYILTIIYQSLPLLNFTNITIWCFMQQNLYTLKTKFQLYHKEAKQCRALGTKLEPVCCKKQQKKVPGQLLVCGILLKILNGIELILDDHGNNLDSFSLESFRTFRGPLLHKPVTVQELFLAVSYSKPALEAGA